MKKSILTLTLIGLIIGLIVICYFIFFDNNYSNNNQRDIFQNKEDNPQLIDEDNEDNININNEENQNNDSDTELKKSAIKPEIILEVDNFRTNHPINFSLKGQPKNSNITWDMGDESVLYGEEITHRYETSTYFTINVTAIWDKEYSITSKTIKVLNQDAWMLCGPAELDYKVITGFKSFSLGLVIEKGLTIPTINISLSVWNLTRDLEIGVKLFIDGNETNPSQELSTLISEILNPGLDKITYKWTFPPDITKEYDNDRPYSVRCYFNWVHYTGHAEFYFSQKVTF